ncbi:P-loop NTPase [Thiovibrio sp. JS02]
MQATGRATIIPVASGKGGVGKSIFSASLAIALANRGHDTVAVDLDLGGSNLHTYLGLANTNPGVGDYLKQRLGNLQSLIVPTTIKNLRFLPGDGKTPFMADIPTGQRFQLLEELQKIPARYVLVDLGAGSSINTMNFFGLSNNGIIITTLDSPALMNALVFLRNFMFANILALARENTVLRKMLLDAYRQPANRENLTVQSILACIALHDGPLAERIKRRCGFFQPRFVYNMGDQAEDVTVATRMEATLQKSLAMRSSTLGLIYYDELVRKAVRKGEVFLPAHPASAYARCLDTIASRLLQPASAAKASPDALVAEARRNA